MSQVIMARERSVRDQRCGVTGGVIGSVGGVRRESQTRTEDTKATGVGLVALP